MQVLYDPAAIAGQAELETAFDTNAQIPFEIELSDTLGVNGTTFQFNGSVSERKRGFPKDGAVTTDYIIEVGSAITIVAAS